jgi:hypothetical protein
MKVKGNKKRSGNGPKKIKLKGVKKPTGGFRKGKKSKATLKRESTAINADDSTVPERKEERNTKKYARFKGGKKNSESKGKKSSELPGSDHKRKAEDDSGQVKKKLRVKKEDEVQTRLDRKELKVARRKRKQNYELTVSLIKKYDGLRRYVKSYIKDCSCEVEIYLLTLTLLFVPVCWGDLDGLCDCVTVMLNTKRLLLSCS